MLLRDFIAKDPSQSGGIRILRTILESLANAENLSASLIWQTPETQVEEIEPLATFSDALDHMAKNGLEDYVIENANFQTMHTSPFLDGLRSNTTFRHAEQYFVWSNCKSLDGSSPFTKLEYGELFEGRFASYLFRIPNTHFIVMVGPVWIELEEASDSAAFVDLQSICANLAEVLDGITIGTPSGGFSLSRVIRTVGHRGRAVESDISLRLFRIFEALVTVLDIEIDDHEVSADYFDQVSEQALFFVSNKDHIGTGGIEMPEMEVSYDENPKYRVSNRFTLDHSTPAPRIKIESIFEVEITREAAPSFPDDLLAAWSKFHSDFLAKRNAYYLERILLLRLWLQDNFNGTSLNDEDGLDRKAIFDELSRRIQSMFGADGCNIFRLTVSEAKPNEDADADAGHSFLRRIGSHFQYDYLTTDEHVEAQHVENAGYDIEQRDRSLCYRVIDHGVTTFRGDLEPNELATITDHSPKTVYVSHLLYRGRPWGVIELAGRNHFQFTSHTKRWLDEIIRVITPILYDHWLLMGLRNISAIAVDRDATIDEKYSRITEEARRLLLSNSARLYLQGARQTSEYTMTCHRGIAWPDNAGLKFELQDESSKSANTISNRELWSYGTVNSEAFGSREDTDRIELTKSGHRYYAIIPMQSGSGNYFASMFFTTKDFGSYTPAWTAIIETISEHLSTAMEALHLQEKEIEDKVEYYAHSMKTGVDQMFRSSERLLRILAPLLSDSRRIEGVEKFLDEVEVMASLRGGSARPLSQEARVMMQALRKTFPSNLSTRTDAQNLPTIVSDFQQNLRVVRKSAVNLARDGNEAVAEEKDIHDFSGAWTSLRLSLLQCSSSRMSQRPYSRGDINLPGSVLPIGLRYRIPEDVLTEVFKNLVDNAIKYDFSAPSVQIKAFSHHLDQSVTIEVRNMAPCLSVHDANRVASGGFRAKYAKVRDETGSAIGLDYCFTKCAHWGIKMTYEVPTLDHNSKTKSRNGWHIVRLQFPSEYLELEDYR